LPEPRIDQGDVRVTGQLKARMIQMLGDPDAQRILSCVSRESKTVSTIEAELALSSSTTYRKIGELKESGLLMVDRFSDKPEGKKEAMYICTFKEVKFTTTEAGEHGGGEIELDIKLSGRAEEKRWFDWFFSSSSSKNSQARSV
jgi:predicted transcriptional regulator